MNNREIGIVNASATFWWRHSCWLLPLALMSLISPANKEFLLQPPGAVTPIDTSH